MIVEVAEFTIRAGTQAEFDQAVQRGVREVIAHAHGYRRHEILLGLESADRVLLIIEWDTLEDHTVGFRGSAAFARWREIVSPFFAQPPRVEHYRRTAGSRAGQES
jgi:heme-degrading monooxygenase HmoA